MQSQFAVKQKFVFGPHNVTLHIIIFILVYVSESYWIKKQLEMKNSNYKCPLDGCWNDVPSKITNDCRVKEKCQNKEKWIDEKKPKQKLSTNFSRFYVLLPHEPIWIGTIAKRT